VPLFGSLDSLELEKVPLPPISKLKLRNSFQIHVSFLMEMSSEEDSTKTLVFPLKTEPRTLEEFLKFLDSSISQEEFALLHSFLPIQKTETMQNYSINKMDTTSMKFS
jgi:hypothetical protein